MKNAECYGSATTLVISFISVVIECEVRLPCPILLLLTVLIYHYYKHMMSE